MTLRSNLSILAVLVVRRLRRGRMLPRHPGEHGGRDDPAPPLPEDVQSVAAVVSPGAETSPPRRHRRRPGRARRRGPPRRHRRVRLAHPLRPRPPHRRPRGPGPRGRGPAGPARAAAPRARDGLPEARRGAGPGREGAGPGRRRRGAPRLRAQDRPRREGLRLPGGLPPLEGRGGAGGGGAGRAPRPPSLSPSSVSTTPSSPRPSTGSWPRDGRTSASGSARPASPSSWSRRRPLKLRFRVPERYLATVHVGRPVAAHVDPYPAEAFDGTVSLVGGSVDPSSRTFLVEAEFPNRDGRLRPGLFARVELQLGEE